MAARSNAIKLNGYTIDQNLSGDWKFNPDILTIYREKIPLRFASLLKTAHSIKSYIHLAIGVEKVDAVDVDDLLLARATIGYFNSIHQFKIDHIYGNNLVNNAKIAAFTSIHIIREKPIRLNSEFPDVVIGGVVNANAIFAYRFIINILGIPPKAVPSKVVKDLIYSLQTEREKDPELSYLTMLFLETAYGGPRACQKVMSICRRVQNFLSIHVP